MEIVPATGHSRSGVKYAFANVAAATTDGVVKAAVTDRRIRVHQVFNICGATATTVTYNTKPAGAGVAISPLITPAINGGEVLPFSPVGWFETGIGEGLTVTTGAGTATGILVGYSEV